MKRERVITTTTNRQPVEIVPDEYKDYHEALDKAKVFKESYTMAKNIANRALETLKNLVNSIKEKFSNR